MNPHSLPRAASRGLTLVELLATLAVLAVTLGSALPGYQQARERRHLDGVAAQLGTDILHARSLAVSQAAPVRLQVQQLGGASCYVVHTGPAGSCSCASNGQTQCRAGSQALRVAALDATVPVRLQLNSSSILFDGDRGTVTPTGTLTLSLADGRSLRTIVNIMGRSRTCSPGGVVAGYPAC